MCVRACMVCVCVCCVDAHISVWSVCWCTHLPHGGCERECVSVQRTCVVYMVDHLTLATSHWPPHTGHVPVCISCRFVWTSHDCG